MNLYLSFQLTWITGMLPHIKLFFKQFFEKNLFERIIIYIFLSALITKIVFEFGLGQHYFAQSQNKQWIFYVLLGLDYLISLRKILNTRITLNPISIFALSLFIMIAHGLFIGVINHNPPFVIFNDTIPFLMIAINIFRMQSFVEISKPVNFRFLFTICVTLASLTCFFGVLAGKPSVGAVSIFFPLVMAALIMLRPFPKWALPVIVVLIVLTMSDINRTTLFFIGAVTAGYIGLNMIYNPAKSFILMLCVILITVVGWGLLPKDSQTYVRIVGLTEVDLSQRTGSIGERQAEQDAVFNKLEKSGITTQWVGLGFGGLYEMRSTHQYIRDYGHAHYAWVWFNLRYGRIGYLYMIILTSVLIYSGVRNFNHRTEIGIFVSFLCLIGFIFLFTHVNSVFLLSGLPFLYIHKRPISDKEPI